MKLKLAPAAMLIVGALALTPAAAAKDFAIIARNIIPSG
jgi:hypothetical protein